MSEDDIKAEYRRERKDCADIWGHGHLTREYIQKEKETVERDAGCEMGCRLQRELGLVSLAVGH